METVVKTGRASNSYSDLAELEIFGTQAASEGSLTLGMISRFDAVQVLDPDWSWQVTVRLKRAYLKLHCNGCAVHQDGRAGDTPRPATAHLSGVSTVSIERTKSHEIDVGGGADISSKVPSLAARVKAGLKRGTVRKEQLKLEGKVDQKAEAIRALPGNRWVIKDVELPTLLGRYSPEDDFCSIETNAASWSVRAALYFMPCDMALEYEKAEGAPIINIGSRPAASSVVKALIAKNLREISQKKAVDGSVGLATASVSFSGSKHDRSRANNKDIDV